MQIIKIETLFKIGDTVYFVTDEMQKPFLITAIVIQEKSIKYKVGNSCYQEIECFGFEITDTKKSNIKIRKNDTHNYINSLDNLCNYLCFKGNGKTI